MAARSMAEHSEQAWGGYTKEFVQNKQLFANFISSHESEFNIRGDFFKKLNEYRRVESAGTYLNNMPMVRS